MTKININRQIWNLISQDLAIQKCMNNGVINNRALAKFLIKKYNLSFSLDAVLSAVRRHELVEEKTEISNEIEKALSSMIIMTRSNMASVKLRADAFVNIANDYLTKQALKENFRMVKTKEIIKVILNQKDLDKKKEVFAPEYILEVSPNLCEIRITLTQDMTYVRGFLSRITSELALYSVNVHDIIVGVPEILIYVEENDMIQAQKCLMDLRKE